MILSHPARDKRNQRQPEQQVHIRPQDGATHMLHGVQHVVVVVPVNGEIDEAENVTEKTGSTGCSDCKSVPCGTFSSSTMMVIRMAITPSLNASRRVLPMVHPFVEIPGSGLCCHLFLQLHRDNLISRAVNFNRGMHDLFMLA